MKRRIIAAAAIALTGCTPAETRAWIAWYQTDPTAAAEYANRPEVQASLLGSDAPQYGEWLHGYTPGDCDSYTPLFESYGLPAATFRRIAWRESGCDHTSFVRDRDDLGGGLLGINLRAGASRWFDWCGLTVNNVTDAQKNVECAAAAYDRMGMAPWQ